MKPSRNINLRLYEELIEEVDRLRGDVPRTLWIRRAIEQRVHSEKKIANAMILGQSAERAAARHT